ncbi:flagellar hook protein FlgE [Halomonadaceae bacterium KBTZ08]
MAFNIALSGLNAAQTDLDVKGNNIANASTTGFKRSRAEFGDLYSSGLLNLGSTETGEGVQVQDTRQLFQQGNITSTNNGLDMAIDGEGFFVLQGADGEQFSRAGQFGVDKNGVITNNQGAELQGFQPQNGEVGNGQGELKSLTVNQEKLEPKATANVDVNVNLDSRETIPPENPFDATKSKTYNHSTTSTIYDSLGNPHEMTQYFVKQNNNNNEWKSHIKIDGEKVAEGALTFNENGALDTGEIQVNGWVPKDSAGNPNGAKNPSDFVIDYADTTQFGSGFAVDELQQDGFATGRLTGLDVTGEGVIQARFSNGRSEALGQVALANFQDKEGLAPIGDTAWAQTFESGEPAINPPNTGSVGSIRSSSVEESNVDLSEQLVGLITAQRNFQANSKTIETSDQITQTIINLR